MASRFLAVSMNVSPFETLLVPAVKSIVSAPSRRAASPKLVRVRVEFSKNRLTHVLPVNSGDFRGPSTSRRRNTVALSRINRISSAERSSNPNRWRRFQNGGTVPKSFSSTGSMAKSRSSRWGVPALTPFPRQSPARSAGAFSCLRVILAIPGAAASRGYVFLSLRERSPTAAVVSSPFRKEGVCGPLAEREEYAIIDAMDDCGETKILILAPVAEAARWAEILRGPGLRVWLGREAIPPQGQPDVIVTGDAAAAAPARGEVGVVRVGVEGEADVHLPRDFNPRELQTACRLLGQVVHLRRCGHAAAETQRALSAAARTDPLTGLPNRRAWDAQLAERIALAAGTRQPLCLAVLDLDHFKQVNDLYGDVAGDRVLCAAARAIAGSIRQDDFAARLGGDEFGVLLWAPDAQTAGAVVRRIQAGVQPHLAAAGVQPVTASAGYAVSFGSDGSAEALFAAADAALGEAKRAGRNRTVSGQ